MSETIVRVLDPFAQRHLLHKAWAWGDAAPEWYRAMRALDTPNELEFLTHACRINVSNCAIWLDGQYSALPQFTEFAGGLFEAHLYVRRGAAVERLCDEWRALVARLFKHAGAREVYGWIWERNLPLLRLARACGLLPDGATRERGVMAGKTARFVRLKLTII